MTKALLIAGIILILGVAGLAGALLGGALMIGTQPPYLITSGTSPFDVVTPPLYGVAYVYPNGSYILLMWVFNPNQYPIDAGTWGVREMSPKIGFWGPYGNPVANITFQPAPLNGIVPPFTFRTEDMWVGTLPNETAYEGELLQPAASGVLWYNGSGTFYTSFNVQFAISGIGTYEDVDWKFIGNNAGPQELHLYDANGNPITINVSNTHVWILVPPFAVWKQEVPPNYPLPQCINITNKPLPPWWGQRALECFR